MLFLQNKEKLSQQTSDIQIKAGAHIIIMSLYKYMFFYRLS